MNPQPKPSKRGPKPRKRIPRRRSPRQQGKSSISKLHRILWAHFAAYVKHRDGNVCFTCGRTGLEGKNWQAGHFVRKDGHEALRYEPKNVHSQCGRCNLWLRGNVARYAMKILEVYGVDELRRIMHRESKLKQWAAWELEDMIQAIRVSPQAFECLYYDRYL